MKRLLLLLILTACATNGNPLGQWAPLGSHVSAWVVNTTDADWDVSVRAPELNMERVLGVVNAHDSTFYNIPFADTNIEFLVHGLVKQIIKPDSPGKWRLVIK